MRKLLLYIFLIALLASCKQRINEEAALEYAIEKQMAELDFVLESMQDYIDNYSRSLNDLQNIEKYDLQTIKQTERLSSWKQPYLRSKKKEDLLNYTDSVTNIPDYKWVMFKDDERKAVTNQISANRKLVLESDGKIAEQSLFYWTLQAERNLLSSHAQKLGDCHFILPHRIYLNKKAYQLGDTVFASFQLYFHNAYIDSISFNFDSITVSNVANNLKVANKIKQIGNFMFLTIVPDKPGEYFIKGEVNIKSRTKQYYGRELELRGNKSFTVK